MAQRLSRLAAFLCLALLVPACSRSNDSRAAAAGTGPPPGAALPPAPVVNHTAADAAPGEKVDHGELIVAPDDARRNLHQQHHPHGLLETRRVPGRFAAPSMKEVEDYYLSKKDLDVINPGPGEYVHVMEGQRHGYRNLTIGITYTAPGGAPPMHTHQGEESHVLTSGQKVMYALGDKLFVATGPYIINIPPMTPHSFQNLDDRVAELVVIFPTNVWEYDVLDYFPFSSSRAKALAAEARAQPTPAPAAAH